MGITYGGSSYIMLKCAGGISFVKRAYLTPFKEEIQFWRRISASGNEFFVVTAGMFVVGIILSETGIRADISAEIKEIAGMI